MRKATTKDNKQLSNKRNKDIKLNVVGVPPTNINVNKTLAGQKNEDYHLYKISIDTNKKNKNKASLPKLSSKPQASKALGIEKDRCKPTISKSSSIWNYVKLGSKKSKSKENKKPDVCLTMPGEGVGEIKIVNTPTQPNKEILPQDKKVTAETRVPTTQVGVYETDAGNPVPNDFCLGSNQLQANKPENSQGQETDLRKPIKINLLPNWQDFVFDGENQKNPTKGQSDGKTIQNPKILETAEKELPVRSSYNKPTSFERPSAIKSQSVNNDTYYPTGGQYIPTKVSSADYNRPSSNQFSRHPPGSEKTDIFSERVPSNPQSFPENNTEFSKTKMHPNYAVDSAMSFVQPVDPKFAGNVTGGQPLTHLRGETSGTMFEADTVKELPVKTHTFIANESTPNEAIKKLLNQQHTYKNENTLKSKTPVIVDKEIMTDNIPADSFKSDELQPISKFSVSHSIPSGVSARHSQLPSDQNVNKNKRIKPFLVSTIPKPSIKLSRPTVLRNSPRASIHTSNKDTRKPLVKSNTDSTDLNKISIVKSPQNLKPTFQGTMKNNDKQGKSGYPISTDKKSEKCFDTSDAGTSTIDLQNYEHTSNLGNGQHVNLSNIKPVTTLQQPDVLSFEILQHDYDKPNLMRSEHSTKKPTYTPSISSNRLQSNQSKQSYNMFGQYIPSSERSNLKDMKAKPVDERVYATKRVMIESSPSNYDRLGKVLDKLKPKEKHIITKEHSTKNVFPLSMEPLQEENNKMVGNDLDESKTKHSEETMNGWNRIMDDKSSNNYDRTEKTLDKFSPSDTNKMIKGSNGNYSFTFDGFEGDPVNGTLPGGIIGFGKESPLSVKKSYASQGISASIPNNSVHGRMTGVKSNEKTPIDESVDATKRVTNGPYLSSYDRSNKSLDKPEAEDKQEVPNKDSKIYGFSIDVPSMKINDDNPTLYEGLHQDERNVDIPSTTTKGLTTESLQEKLENENVGFGKNLFGEKMYITKDKVKEKPADYYDGLSKSLDKVMSKVDPQTSTPKSKYTFGDNQTAEKLTEEDFPFDNKLHKDVMAYPDQVSENDPFLYDSKGSPLKMERDRQNGIPTSLVNNEYYNDKPVTTHEDQYLGKDQTPPKKKHSSEDEIVDRKLSKSYHLIDDVRKIHDSSANNSQDTHSDLLPHPSEKTSEDVRPVVRQKTSGRQTPSTDIMAYPGQVKGKYPFQYDSKGVPLKIEHDNKNGLPTTLINNEYSTDKQATTDEDQHLGKDHMHPKMNQPIEDDIAERKLSKMYHLLDDLGKIHESSAYNTQDTHSDLFPHTSEKTSEDKPIERQKTSGRKTPSSVIMTYPGQVKENDPFQYDSNGASLKIEHGSKNGVPTSVLKDEYSTDKLETSHEDHKPLDKYHTPSKKIKPIKDEDDNRKLSLMYHIIDDVGKIHDTSANESQYTHSELAQPRKKTSEASMPVVRQKPRGRKRKLSLNPKSYSQKSRESSKGETPFEMGLQDQMLYLGKIPNTTYNVFFSPESTSEKDRERLDKTKSVKKSRKHKRQEKHMGTDSPKGLIIFVNKKKTTDVGHTPFSRVGEERLVMSAVIPHEGSLPHREVKQRNIPTRNAKSPQEPKKPQKDEEVNFKSDVFNYQALTSELRTTFDENNTTKVSVDRSPRGTTITERYLCGCLRVIHSDPNGEIMSEEIINTYCTEGNKCTVSLPELRKTMRVISYQSSRSENSVPTRFSDGSINDNRFKKIEVVVNGVLSKRPISPKYPPTTMKGANYTGTFNLKSNKVNGLCNVYLEPKLKRYLLDNWEDFRGLLRDT